MQGRKEKGRKAYKKAKRRARNQETITTKGPTLKIGIDVAKRRHSAALFDPEMRQIGHILAVKNTRKDAERLLAKALEISERVGLSPLWGMEATGNYHLPLLHFLVEHGQSVVVFNPYQVKKYKDVCLAQTDTDPHSAVILCDMLDEVCRRKRIRLKAREVREINPDLEQAKHMARYRFSLARSVRDRKRQTVSIVDCIFPEFEQVFGKGYLSKKTARMVLGRYPDPATLAKLEEEKVDELVMDARRTSKGRYGDDAVKTLIRLARDSFGVRCTGIVGPACRQIRFLLWEMEFVEAHIQAWDEEIARVMEDFPYYREVGQLGCVTPTMMAAFVGEIGVVDSFTDPDQIVSFAGWDVREARSGDTREKRRRLNKRGRTELRDASYWLAGVSIMHEGKDSEYYARKRREGRTHKEALIALARNKLKQIFTAMKNSRYKPQTEARTATIAESGTGTDQDQEEASQAPVRVTPPGLPG